MTDPAKRNAEAVLAERVYAGGRSKPFGEVTLEEVQARAQELRDTTGWGPTAKVASVAMAWGQLARLMQEQGAATVGDLDPQVVLDLAERLWVVMPGGSMLL
jgi:hypothetical protein